MLKKMNEYKHVGIVVLCSLIGLLALAFISNVVFQSQAAHVEVDTTVEEMSDETKDEATDNRSEIEKKTTEERATSTKDTTDEKQDDRVNSETQQERVTSRFRVGKQVEAHVLHHEAKVIYKGKIIQTYAESGTVLARTSRGGPLAISEFSYTDVVDIHAKTYIFLSDDTPEKKHVDLHVRAVLTNEGELIALKELTHNKPIGPKYKIVEQVSKQKNKRYDIDELRCKQLPSYIYDLLIEWKQANRCMT